MRNETTTARAIARPMTEAARVRASKGLIVGAAFMSFVASVYLWFQVDREQGLFVGLWVPSILSLGALLFSGQRERS